MSQNYIDKYDKNATLVKVKLFMAKPYNGLNYKGKSLKTGILMGLDTKASEQQKTVALAFIVFRLRNNLFHGTKGQYGFSGQLENFRQANALLRVWIDTS